MEFIEKVREGYAPFGPYQTWYRITGDLTSGRTPLVVIHGGPGCTHDYVDAFKDVAASGHAVIHYDQLGNGRSTHLPDKDPSFWTVSLFLDELNNLLDHLQISQNYAILGQSWGGMLGSEHAILQPKGLRAFIPANSPTCMRTWVSESCCLKACMKPCSSMKPPAPTRTRNTSPPRESSTTSTSAGSTHGRTRWRAPSPRSMQTRPCTTP